MNFILLHRILLWPILGCLLQPGVLFNQPQKSMRVSSFQLIKFCYTRTDPAAKTKSIGLQAGARVVMVFARHLNNFIVTQILLFIGITPSRQLHRDTKLHCRLSGLGTVSLLQRDPWLLYRLPGLAKNKSPRPFATAVGRLRRHLIKPPGRYRQ